MIMGDKCTNPSFVCALYTNLNLRLSGKVPSIEVFRTVQIAKSKRIKKDPPAELGAEWVRHFLFFLLWCSNPKSSCEIIFKNRNRDNHNNH